MTKYMHFSARFRPSFPDSLDRSKPLVTSRLFDDKAYSVGDEVDLYVTETGQPFGSSQVTGISVAPFAAVFANVPDQDANLKMYEVYYPGREINAETPVKEITLQLL